MVVVRSLAKPSRILLSKSHDSDGMRQKSQEKNSQRQPYEGVWCKLKTRLPSVGKKILIHFIQRRNLTSLLVR